MNKSLRNHICLMLLLLLCPFVVQGQEAFQRDIKKTFFVPKGQCVAGLSVNYSQSTQNDYQFLIIENISGDTYSFKVSPMVCYIVKDDLGLGGKFA